MHSQLFDMIVSVVNPRARLYLFMPMGSFHATIICTMQQPMLEQCRRQDHSAMLHQHPLCVGRPPTPGSHTCSSSLRSYSSLLLVTAQHAVSVLQVTGLGFAAQIAMVLYNAAAGYMAARRRDIVMHRRCMVRMAGLAYGVLPFKQLFAAFPPLNYLPGATPRTMPVSPVRLCDISPHQQATHEQNSFWSLSPAKCFMESSEDAMCKPR